MSRLRYASPAILTAALLFAGTASAQTWYDVREAHQRERIQDGRADGSLTRHEYRNLQYGQQRIERYENYAERDGRVSGRERARLDRMIDQQGRQIYRQSHDRQQAGDRNGWGNGWRHDNGGRDGWGRGNDRNYSWNHGGDDRRHNGWTQGNHHGWDGKRPPGVERRDARQDQRIHNGVRDGSLTRGEANRLGHGRDRIDRHEARARSDGRTTAREHARIDRMQDRQGRQIHNARHNERTAPTTGAQPSHNWGNGGWQRQQRGSTMPAAGTQQRPSRNWGGNTDGGRMQRAASTPSAPRPTFNRTSNPTGSRTRGDRR